jgi:exosortase
MKTRAMAARVLVFAALVSIACIIGNRVLLELWTYARSESSASHVILIPFVSLGLVWYRRRSIFKSVRTDYLGAVVLAIAAGLIATASTRVGPAADSTFLLPVAALVIAWMGAFWLAFGAVAFRSAAFAMTLLLLTIPIPPALLDVATAVLKVGSASVVSGLFTISGTAYHRDAYVFWLPRVSIEIANECSGIRSSIALGLTALLAGHLMLTSVWTRALLMLAVLPVTVVKNGIRIASLSWLANDVDPSFLEGSLHTDGGILFFLFALALLHPVLAALRRFDAAPGWGTCQEASVLEESVVLQEATADAKAGNVTGWETKA